MAMVVMVVVTVVGTDFVLACNISFGRRSGVGSLSSEVPERVSEQVSERVSDRVSERVIALRCFRKAILFAYQPLPEDVCLLASAWSS